jgi:hypothetical protein
MRQQAQAGLRDILRQKEMDTASLETEKMRELLIDHRSGKFKLVVRWTMHR